MEKTIQIFKRAIFLKIALLYIILLPIFLFFGDRVGWEGDDIGQLEGIINFQYKGATGVYIHYWQPLAYQLNIFVNNLVGNPNFLFVMPQIFGAANIVFLMGAVYLFSEKRISLPLIFSFLLLLPELFFCGLYYNSTVFAMLPMTVALLFLFWKPSSPFWDDIRYLIIGFASTLAVFFRFEFLLCLPLIYYLIIVEVAPKNRKIILSILASILIVALVLITGIFEPAKIFRLATQGYEEAVDIHKLYLSKSLKITLTAINLIAWMALFSYFIYFLKSRVKSQNWKALLVLFPVALLLYPFTKLIFSPKYLVPAIIFVPFVLAKMAMELQERLGRTQFKRLSYGIIATSMLLQILSLQPAKAFPYVQIKPVPTYIGTADGARTFGAYLRGYNMIRKNNLSRKNNSEVHINTYSITHRIAKIIENSDRNFTVISLDKKGNFFASERVLQSLSLYLQIEGYQIHDYTLKFNEFPVNNQSKTITLMKNNKIVKLLRLEDPEFSNYQEEDDENNILIKLPFISKDGPLKMRDFYKSLEAV